MKIPIAILALLSATPAQAAATAANLLPNGDFEDWHEDTPKGWTCYDNTSAKRSYQMEAEDVCSGAASLRATLRSQRGVFVGAVAMTEGLARGEVGVVSVHLRGRLQKGALAHLSVRKLESGGHRAVAATTPELTGSWQELSVQFTKDWDGRVFVYAGASLRGSGATILIDNCELVSKGVAPPPFSIPGSQRKPGYRAHHQDGHLYVDGKPFFFVGFELSSEVAPLAELKRRGVNTIFVWPRDDFVEAYREVEDGGLMFIPYLVPANVYRNRRGWSEEKLRQVVTSLLPAPNLLLWNMSDDAHLDDLGYIAFGSGLVRALDQGRRPIGADCHSGYELYGQFLDAPRNYAYPMLQARTNLRDYKRWLRENRNSWGKRNPLFYTVTQPHAQGWYGRLIHPGPAWNRGAAVPGPAQTRSIHYGAIAAGARGFFPFSCVAFKDDLQGADRFEAYSLLATELSITGPLFAGGVPRPDLATSNEWVEASPFVFEKGYAVVVQRFCPFDNFEFDANVATDVAVDLPDDAEPDAKVYEASFPRLREAAVRQVDGERQFVLPKLDVATTAVITADHELARELATQIDGKLSLAAEFSIAAARAKHRKYAPIVAQLNSRDRDLGRAADTVAQAQTHYDAGRYAEAYSLGREAEVRMRGAIRRHWDEATDGGRLAETCAYLHEFHSLPRYYELADRIRKGRWSDNLLTDPSFESMLASAAGVRESVHIGREAKTEEEAPLSAGHKLERGAKRFVTGVCHTGKVALAFESRVPLTYQGKKSDEWDWVKQDHVTEMIPVQKGDIVEISAWLNVPTALEGTSRGAILWGRRDGGWNFAGYHEVVRPRQTDGWEKVEQLIHISHEETKGIGVRVGLCGRGTAYFDDLSVRKLLD